MKNGNYRQLYINNTELVFLRESENEKMIVALNSSDKKIKVDFDLSGINYSKLYDVLNNEDIPKNYDKQNIEIYPN